MWKIRYSVLFPEIFDLTRNPNNLVDHMLSYITAQTFTVFKKCFPFTKIDKTYLKIIHFFPYRNPSLASLFLLSRGSCWTGSCQNVLRVQVRPPYKRERASIRHAMMKLGLSVKRPFQTATRVVNYKGAVCISASATWQIAAFMQECHWNHCDKLAALKGTSKYHCNYYPVEYILTAFVIFAPQIFASAIRPIPETFWKFSPP